MNLPKLILILFNIKTQKVQFLPARFDGDVFFELLPCHGSTCGSRGMEGVDKRYDGHAWSHTMTSHIHNDFCVKFQKSHSVGHLICENPRCDYRTQASKSNEIEWIGTTKHPFNIVQIPPLDSTVLCKVCRQSPTCLNSYNSQIYYIQRTVDLSRASIHLGVHSHPFVDGHCRESLKAITGLIAPKWQELQPPKLLPLPWQ